VDVNQFHHECQLHSLPDLALPDRLSDVPAHLLRRVGRIFKRRAFFIQNWFRDIMHPGTFKTTPEAHVVRFQPGDRVRIRSKEEIRSTLNRWNNLKGCTFLEEMWIYCETEQQVMKRVEKFLDERDYHVKKTSGTVLLSGVICHGSIDFGKCDRSCFFFWRDEWLERIG